MPDAAVSGAKDRLEEELGMFSGAFDDESFARLSASTRESLGADAYEEALRRGRELTLEEAVACALAATSGPD